MPRIVPQGRRRCSLSGCRLSPPFRGSFSLRRAPAACHDWARAPSLHPGQRYTGCQTCKTTPSVGQHRWHDGWAAAQPSRLETWMVALSEHRQDRRLHGREPSKLSVFSCPASTGGSGSDRLSPMHSCTPRLRLRGIVGRCMQENECFGPCRARGVHRRTSLARCAEASRAPQMDARGDAGDGWPRPLRWWYRRGWSAPCEGARRAHGLGAVDMSPVCREGRKSARRRKSARKAQFA